MTFAKIKIYLYNIYFRIVIQKKNENSSRCHLGEQRDVGILARGVNQYITITILENIMDKLKQRLMTILNENSRPLLLAELFSEMNLSPKEAAAFLDLTESLEKSGELIRTKKDKLALPIAMNLIIGKLSVNAKGFGFLVPHDKNLEDVFIAPNDLSGAMNDDIVYVKMIKTKDSKRKLEGKVVKIIERANNYIVGRVDLGEHFAFVLPDNQALTQDIYIPRAGLNGAKDGQKVVVEITKFAERRRNPEGKIIEILGFSGEKGVDVLALIRKYKLPENFSAKVLKQAKKVSAEREFDLSGRRDLSEHLIITIDGADAKDLDDAVEVRKLANGNYYLGVHIADVSHYVKEGSKLDKEALKRGTSVYLVDRVIPMLPKELSNGICSLNPHVLRLTMTCEMEIDSNGKVVKYDIFPSAIKSKYRLTYQYVSDILENREELSVKVDEKLMELLQNMAELAGILREKREKRGAIDFDFAETYIELDDKGNPVAIKARERRIANRMIEEFMLVANETVAEYVFWLDKPFVYRVHPQPDNQKLQEFNRFIHNFGYNLKISGDKVYPKELQKLLKTVSGTEKQVLIERLLLRSLSQAHYSALAAPHFGLAAEYYCHFTSPIRRYPDLQIHRILKEIIKGDMDSARKSALAKIVVTAAEQSSIRERIAEKAERESEDIKKVQYMERFIGQEFIGIISGVTNFGIFTQLENTVEGLTRFSMLEDDYYNFDQENYRLVGERTKKIYAIGDKVKVLLENVKLEQREIDFRILEKF